MNTKTITLRSILNDRYIRDHILKFFRTTKFNSQYLSIYIRVSGDNGSIFYTLGSKSVIDLNNNDDKIKYVDTVISRFNGLDSDAYNTKTSIGNNLVIYYLDSDKKGYNQHLRNTALFNKFNIDVDSEIKPIKNIPVNTNYKSWLRRGNVTYIDANKFIVKNVNFDNQIEEILVYSENIMKTDLTVNYKEIKDSLNLTDFKTKNDKFKRTFSSGLEEEVLYFDQNNPFFMFNDSISKPIFKTSKDGKIKQRLDIIQPIKDDNLSNEESKMLDSQDLSLETVKEVSTELENNTPRPVFNISTLDIETYLEDGVFKLLSICFGRGDSIYKFYISDYESTEHLLNNCFNSLFTQEFNGTFIFIHNGSNFDLIFLVKYLLTRNDIEITPIYKDGKFISLKIKYGVYSLSIRDSMLMLKSSLAKLGKAFKVDVMKDVYPYNFPKKDNLNYVGAVPEYKFFDNKKVSLSDYNNYLERFNNDWSLKNETLKYCTRDCITLHQILIKFCNLIWDTFGVDASKCPTLPSLAFRIFRTKFLGDNINIPLLNSFIYEKLSQAFFGGHVDMYIPKGPLNSLVGGEAISVDKLRSIDIAKLSKEKGTDYIKSNFKTLKHYDINSLYPSSMLYSEFPTDIIGYFIGDITLIDDYSYLYKEKLGIYKVKVTGPSIKHPIIPIRIDGVCVYPEGNWTGWYFSEEIKNAEKYGYKFEIMEGFVFQSNILFTDYIHAMNKIKTQSDKDSPLYFIAKILMNSLFGRFGINPFLSKNEFIKRDKFDESMKNSSYNNRVEEFVDFGSHYLASIKPTNEELENANNLPANVAIALAISSYSRVVMSEFKNRNDITLYYSDTDSLIVDSYLPNEFVDSKKIGLYKLEAEYILFIALGPKVYGAIDVNGKS